MLRPAELVIVRTSEGCTSYRLRVLGRLVWSNRAFTDKPESHAAVRRRSSFGPESTAAGLWKRKERRRRRGRDSLRDEGCTLTVSPGCYQVAAW